MYTWAKYFGCYRIVVKASTPKQAEDEVMKKLKSYSIGGTKRIYIENAIKNGVNIPVCKE
jgi:hypothetical protein